MGGNVSGYKLKSFVIRHNEIPRTFKRINKHTLLMYYRNIKSWMTQMPFVDAVLNCYVREIKDNLENNTPLKFCLFLIMLPDILL